ncbi:MAG: hypothetical protein H0T15_07495 [Thermoleophilaceae bacterium]|nr:hypothetical protein [Thermoleophilaceae bacterium]
MDTGTIRRNLSGTTREVTQELGKAVGQVDPNVGKVVSDTGEQLSNIVEGLPDVQSNQLLP